MKWLLIFLLTPIFASGDLLVELSGVNANQGTIGLLIFKSAEGFPNNRKKAIQETSLKPQKGKVTFKIPDLAAGEYAFVVLHDENENMKLDKNFIGYPKEGIAVSNYQKLARPKFHLAAITNPKSPVKLKMLYP